VTLSALTLTARRGFRAREPVAILLSTAVLVPFFYFLWKSFFLRIGDTWPMFIWPAGFAAAAVNIVVMPREGWSAGTVRSTIVLSNAAVVTGLVTVVLVFLYYVAMPWNFFGRTDPIGGEAGFAAVMERAEEELQKTG